MQAQSHYPVMLPDMLKALSPRDHEIYVDGTFGAGGYSAAILESCNCTVIGIDRDPEAKNRAEALLKKYPGRFTFVEGCFGDIAQVLSEKGIGKIDGFILDVGVSSMQIDNPARGFSFRFDGPLDMRMDPENGRKAADLVNGLDETSLADVIYRYGEERQSRRIAKAIVEKRAEKKFETTAELADLLRAVVRRSRKDEIDPATRAFQALRIAVNDELGELERALQAAIQVLKPAGRMIVVSFHSLEDSIVKDFFREHSSGKPSVSRYLPAPDAKNTIFFKVPFKKAIKPSVSEIAENARSRSARLRMAIRTDEAAS